MMHPDPLQELVDIKKYCQLIIEHTRGMSLEDYLNQDFTRLAVERSLMIIGEAAARMRNKDPELFEQFTSLHAAIGLRNRLAHGYDEQISDESIWTVVESGIAQLLTEVDSHS